MTYRAGDKIVVQVTKDMAGILNSNTAGYYIFYDTISKLILEHIKKPRPEPIYIWQYTLDRKIWEQYLGSPGSYPACSRAVRKLTLTEDDDGNKTWTEEVIK